MLTEKILGIIASIFIFLSMILDIILFFQEELGLAIIINILFFGIIITGIILLTISKFIISKKISEQTVFYDTLTFAILWIIALIIPLISPFVLTDISHETFYTWILFIIGLAVHFLYLVGTEFLYKSFKVISENTKNGLFKIVGYLFMAGAMLVFVFYIVGSLLGAMLLPILGLIFFVIAAIIQIIAFSMINEKNFYK